MKKFMVLWHLTRNKTSGVIPGKPLRTFDRFASGLSLLVHLYKAKESLCYTFIVLTFDKIALPYPFYSRRKKELIFDSKSLA